MQTTEYYYTTTLLPSAQSEEPRSCSSSTTPPYKYSFLSSRRYWLQIRLFWKQKCTNMHPEYSTPYSSGSTVGISAVFQPKLRKKLVGQGGANSLPGCLCRGAFGERLLKGGSTRDEIRDNENKFMRMASVPWRLTNFVMLFLRLDCGAPCCCRAGIASFPHRSIRVADLQGRKQEAGKVDGAADRSATESNQPRQSLINGIVLCSYLVTQSYAVHDRQNSN